MEVTNGRRPTSLRLVPDAAYVLAIDVGLRFFTVALCTLDSKQVLLERYPADSTLPEEQYCLPLLKSCVRILKHVDGSKVLGIGLTFSEPLKWPIEDIAKAVEKTACHDVFCENLTTALIKTELSKTKVLTPEPTLYVNWSDVISLGIMRDYCISNTSSLFGHIKVADTGLCVCGEIGCLETSCSTRYIPEKNGCRLSECWEFLPRKAFSDMAKALRIANKVSGASIVVIGGEGATIPAKYLCLIADQCPGLDVRKSGLGDKAVMESACETALDHYLFQTSMLNEVAEYL